MRQVRKAVELQSEALSRRPIAAAATSVAAEPPAPSALPPVPETLRATPAPNGRAEDSVLGSVMEQFEALQKSKVRKFVPTKK